jgi:hypothetical protein
VGTCRLQLFTQDLPTGFVVWVKPTHVEGTQYDDIAASPTETVAQFKRRCLAAKKLDCDPSLVSLRLVKRNPSGVPTAEQEATALQSPASLLADPSLTLAEAGVADGSWLLVVFATSAGSVSPLLAPDTRVSAAEVASMVVERLTAEVIQDTTPAALGNKTLAALHLSNRVEDFTGGDGDAVLDEEQQRALLLCKSEAEVVKFLTPFLWQLRVTGDAADPCRCVLVNSENMAWLDNLAFPLRGMRLKPDLFVAPHVCVWTQPGLATQGSGDCFLFGRLADPRLQRDGCVRELYEAKFGDLTEKHFGELVMYHRLIPGECRGMLFNERGFWLFSSYAAQPVAMVRSHWTTPGSANRVRHFLGHAPPPPPPPPFIPLLRRLLTDLGLRPANAAVGDACTAFLGAGATGRVFAVLRSTPAAEGGVRMALKVVPAGAGADDPSEALCNLGTEFEALVNAASRGAPVVAPVPGSLVLVPPLGGGFLLSRCGAAFDAGSKSATMAAFASLAALHSRGIVHGDARLANLILVDEQPAWIDLAAGILTGPVLATHLPIYSRLDAETLTTSVLRLSRRCGDQAPQLPPPVSAALAAYDSTLPDTVKGLAVAVWSAASAARPGARPSVNDTAVQSR